MSWGGYGLSRGHVCTGSWVVSPGWGGWAGLGTVWVQRTACCQRGPFCVHGPCSAPTVPVTFPQPSKQKRKFSSFFKSLVIELDKDLYGPDNHLVEVRQVVSALESPPSRLPKAPKKLQIWTEDPPKVLSPINPDGSAGDLAPPPPPRDSGIGHLQPRRQMDSK